jgi:hypothetical protein
MAVVRAREVRMPNETIIGMRTRYVGTDELLRGEDVEVTAVIRGSVRGSPRRAPEVTEDEELWERPVAPEDDVRVRARGIPKLVRAPELACFSHLQAARYLPVEVQLEARILAEAQAAARLARRTLDAVVDEALAKHLRAIGFLRGHSGEVPAAGDNERLGGSR